MVRRDGGSRGFAIADYLLEYRGRSTCGDDRGASWGRKGALKRYEGNHSQSTAVLQALYEMLGQNLVGTSRTGLILALPG